MFNKVLSRVLAGWWSEPFDYGEPRVACARAAAPSVSSACNIGYPCFNVRRLGKLGWSIHTRALAITVRTQAASLPPPSDFVFGGWPTIAFHLVRLSGNHKQNVGQGLLPTRNWLAIMPVRSTTQAPPVAELSESGVPVFPTRPKLLRHCIFRGTESKDSGGCAAVTVSHLHTCMLASSVIADSVCTSHLSRMT